MFFKSTAKRQTANVQYTPNLIEIKIYLTKLNQMGNTL